MLENKWDDLERNSSEDKGKEEFNHQCLKLWKQATKHDSHREVTESRQGEYEAWYLEETYAVIWRPEESLLWDVCGHLQMWTPNGTKTLERRLLNQIHTFSEKEDNEIFGNTKTPACLFFQKSGWRNYSECGFGQNCEMHQLHNGTFQAQLLTHSHFCHKRLILIPSRIMGPKISSSQGEKESLSPCVDLCLTDILER